jgi:hypothetical protein
MEKTLTKDDIRRILFMNDKPVRWLKTKLEKKYPKTDFYHLLKEEAAFDVKLHDDIKALFKKEGFITSASEQCDKFTENIIQLNAIISHSTYLLNTNTKEFIKDNVLDIRERMKLLKIIDEAEAECTAGFENAREIIEKGA